MRILLALDKFKGSLTAKQAADAVTRGLRRGGVDADIEICPIADGGEGSGRKRQPTTPKAVRSWPGTD
jgi:glycerate kinase